MTMAMLSGAPAWTLRMSDLAERTSSSLSRLSHLVKRLESRGYVRREADPADGRFTNAILLPAGLSKLESAAPDHVAYVRQLVIDNLSPERLRRLIPGDRVVVAESGIKDSQDIRLLREWGADAVLIGETLVTAPSPEAKIRELFG